MKSTISPGLGAAMLVPIFALTVALILPDRGSADERAECRAALPGLVAAARAEPDDEERWKRVLACYDRTGGWREAQSLFAQLAAEDPKRESHLRHLGFVQWMGDEDTAAGVSLRTALAMAPGDTAARWLLIRSLAAVGDYEAREAEAELATRREPQDPSFWSELALALVDDGRLADAAKVFDRALATGRADATVYRQRAALALRQGRPEEALPLLRAGLARSPDDPDTLYQLANALYRSGDERAGDAVLERLRALGGP